METRQLLLCKRLFEEASGYADSEDAVSSGIAISMFQDCVELLIWTLLKHLGLSVQDQSSFVKNLELLEKANIDLPHKPRLLELNKARVGFKHYGNLPAAEEASKFQQYVGDFLRSLMSTHFGESYDNLSLTDLVSFDELREHLKSAERAVGSNDMDLAMREAGIAKALVFRQLERFVPAVSANLRNGDAIINNLPNARGVELFRYLTEYLERIRQAALAGLLRLRMEDYSYIALLPSAIQFGDGRWQVSGLNYMSADLLIQSIQCLVRVSVRIAAQPQPIIR
jgi:hypothetical protein